MNGRTFGTVLSFIRPREAVVREKRESTLRARAALAGIVMTRSQDDYGRETFLLTHAATTVEIYSLDGVDAFLEEAGIE